MKDVFAGKTNHTTMLRTFHLYSRVPFVGGVFGSVFDRNSRSAPQSLVAERGVRRNKHFDRTTTVGVPNGRSTSHNTRSCVFF